ncbi:MAG TPA: hypothetical protein VFL83_12885 [Anaeromyxobacter sp.]|nr:hypothetical protein [Anaeromyxobacter sp.]
MTIDQLHALYCAGHAEARRVSEGGVLRAFEVCINGAGLAALERLVLEFALHDATNGTPARSLEGFQRAVERAPELFASLGLRPAERVAGRPRAARVRDAA